MFKNVLVGVDGRPNGRDAIALACKLIDLDGKLTLAHVHSGKLRPSHAITPGMVAEEREASHGLLEQERAAADVTADLLSIESMSPGRGMHEQAEEQNADLLDRMERPGGSRCSVRMVGGLRICVGCRV